MTASRKPEVSVHDKLYVNGQWVEPAGKGMLDVINSTTEEVMGNVPEGTPEDINRAVAAARAAFDSWSATSPGSSRRSRRGCPRVKTKSPRSLPARSECRCLWRQWCKQECPRW